MPENEDEYKTLVNVMEWIDRNITFWYERAYLDLIASPILSIGVALLASMIVLPILIFLSLIIPNSKFCKICKANVYFMLPLNIF